MLLINDPKKIIFELSAKSNCTVITKMFFDYIGQLERALKFSSWIHDYRGKYSRRQSLPLKNEEKDYIKIKFIRNPYDRAVSSYFHVMKTKLHIRWRLNKKLSFNDFLDIYHKIKNKRGSDHIKPQTLGREYLNINYFDEIIHVEDLESEINKINKKYNLNLNCNYDSHHWTCKNISEKKQYFVGNLSYNEISKLIKNNELPDYDYFYNDEIRQKVNEIYKNDINLYFNSKNVN